ncbi:MAG: enoyl-CoA hydratase/isomerase family protein [Marinicaulis sp.]|nr:enoyl-CoA hydratase/isomerase family protein [Marinicaulis sp.]
MTEQTLITTIDSRGVARLTMNRPELRNAFNEELIGGICESIGRYQSDPAVRAIVLTGAGKAFSAGADLNMMKRAAGFSASENKDDARRLAHMLHSIYSSPKPTIALVNGPAMGGGLGLIAACDIAIGAESAFFALSEVRLGLIPAVISPFVIDAIGVRQARRYFLTAERFDAATAKEIGLLHVVEPAAGLETALDAMIENIVGCGPTALHEAKSLIRAVAHHPINKKLLDDIAARIARLRTSKEGKEGITAFLEKRKPNWVDGE